MHARHPGHPVDVRGEKSQKTMKFTKKVVDKWGSFLYNTSVAKDSRWHWAINPAEVR